MRSFQQALNDESAHSTLMEPMQQYNTFAKQYGCDLSLPESPFWEHKLNIDDKYQLCLNGLTTTFFSSEDDDKNKLYIGAFQANFKPQAGIVHLAMFHHPKEWLSDGEQLKNQLIKNAQIWLSGHEHRQDYIADPRFLDLPSAAVNPSIHESGASGYNIVDIFVNEHEQQTKLNISVQMRTLQDNPRLYIPRQTHDRKDVLEHSILIPKSPIKVKPSASKMSIEPDDIIRNSNTIEVPHIITQDTTDFVTRLWRLTASKRRSVFQALGLQFSITPLENEEQCVLNALKIISSEKRFDEFSLLLTQQENN